jgi:hypothetical protein
MGKALKHKNCTSDLLRETAGPVTQVFLQTRDAYSFRVKPVNYCDYFVILSFIMFILIK